MILDTYGQFCAATALNTGAAGTYLIGNVIDMEDVRDIGQGNPVYCVAIVSTTATSGGAATLQLKLASDAQAAISTTTSTVHFTTDAIAVAALAAGYSIAAFELPLENPAYERYLGVLQVTGTAAFTAGAVNVFLTSDVSKWKAYANAVV